MNHDILCVMEVNEINRSNYQQPLVPRNDRPIEPRTEDLVKREDSVKPKTTQVDVRV